MSEVSHSGTSTSSNPVETNSEPLNYNDAVQMVHVEISRPPPVISEHNSPTDGSDNQTSHNPTNANDVEVARRHISQPLPDELSVQRVTDLNSSSTNGGVGEGESLKRTRESDPPATFDFDDSQPVAGPSRIQVHNLAPPAAKRQKQDTPPDFSAQDARDAERPDVRSLSSRPEAEPLSAYTCPICFQPPVYATMTPCGHVCCGDCLFTAVKTTMQRSMHHGPEAERPKCPVCRVPIPNWDGKGGGVFGLQPRVLYRTTSTNPRGSR
ncbi:hypothetical protein K474DRAFT_1038751 [Panus rudis PR-1116 ss-1]|nr:hypothetical protein K474DRAFT_1038751 [Panus rudis PR-1116 ss-1]